MKPIFAFIIIVVCFVSTCDAQGKSKSLQDIANLVQKKLTWDVQTEAKGSIMFLDVPFDYDGAAEYLTMTVAKNKSVARPAFISVIIPSDINQANGIFITFARTVKNSAGEFNIQIEKGLTARLKFEKCDDSDCTARMVNGYANDKEGNSQIDVLKNFLNYDHVVFLFLYKNGTHKSVIVPLSSFKQQYKKLL
ncbi:hypothetical protein [Mucilaginibacter rubeus]|uniref:Uncharacterized protein n=1 Tax=Mucilaginibacter rubeus TaxID=2027860 RepID=A0A5C1I372_9SPHI|nr:hypothetical protein [Mucilaginibacter rubeus]QEM12289.1 hypothetical protein DEO27_020440 [Mucilaginibacter rubeus]